MKLARTAVILFLTYHTALGLIAYDCSTQVNISALSLLDVGDCDIPQLTPKRQPMMIQVVQIKEYANTEVIVCKIFVKRTIRTCGFLSVNRMVDGGDMDYVREISGEECRKMHTTRTFRATDSVAITELKLNATNRATETLVGQTENDGECNGEHYSAFGKNFKDVVVTAKFEITSTSYTAQIALKHNKIILPSGVRCNLHEGQCIDAEEGFVFWDVLPKHKCDTSDKYEILYQGTSDKLHDTTYEHAKTVYSVTNDEIIIALTKKDEFEVCGYNVIVTDHPKLFVIEVQGKGPFARVKLTDRNKDVLNYLNSKIVYVEWHIRTQLNTSYRDVIMQQCLLERQVLQNALTLATIAPDEAATRLTKQDGHVAAIAGEVIYLIKCLAAEVKIRPTDECYQHLPVEKKKRRTFLFDP